MRIFIININDYKSIKINDIKKFQHKEISNEKSLYVHCLAYFLLDKILRKKYSIEDREIVFENNKPFLKTNEKQFSISHSNDFITIAISDYDCGVDIEKIKNRDYKKISERMNFDSLSLKDFYKKWTEFEAGYKLTNKKFASIKNIDLEEYYLTAISSNSEEDFEILNNYL